MAAARITVVVPAFDEAPTLEALAEGIAQHLDGRDYAILFVDDGSADDTPAVLRRLCDAQPRVGMVRLARNMGKGAALAAGFARAPEGIVVTMDADLQDDPAELPRMLAPLESEDAGIALVCGWKQRRRDPWHKTLPSRVYNAWVCWRFGLALHDVNSGFKAMRSGVARAVPTRGGLYRLLPVFAHHAGFLIAEVPVQHHPRRHGKSKFGWTRFLHGYADVQLAGRMLLGFPAERAALALALDLAGSAGLALMGVAAAYWAGMPWLAAVIVAAWASRLARAGIGMAAARYLRRPAPLPGPEDIAEWRPPAVWG